MPLVSIVMPAFNCEAFVEQSIKSVLCQTFKDWELIIVDDCSTDRTAEVCDSFTDSRIFLLRNEVNVGGAVSRNKAIERARGRYIAFLDADDVWDYNKLEVQIAFMRGLDVGFCFSGYRVIYEGVDRVDLINVPKRVSFSRLLKHNYIGCLTAIYDTQPYGKIFMPCVRKRQDFALWLEILKKFEYAYSVPEILGSYRVRPGTLSSNKADAFRYYWRVLRDVGECDLVQSVYSISMYVIIVYVKKHFPKMYNFLIMNHLK